MIRLVFQKHTEIGFRKGGGIVILIPILPHPNDSSESMAHLGLVGLER